MIAQVGADPSARQQTRDSALATNGELTTLDAAGYVWSLFGERADRRRVVEAAANGEGRSTIRYETKGRRYLPA